MNNIARILLPVAAAFIAVLPSTAASQKKTEHRKQNVAATASANARAIRPANAPPLSRAKEGREARPLVAVLKSGAGVPDSAREIVQRDLDNSDRIIPVFLDAGQLSAGDTALFSWLSPTRAQFAVRLTIPVAPPPPPPSTAPLPPATPLTQQVRATVYNVSTGAIRQATEFSIGTVPPDRSAALKDSVSRALTERTDAATAMLARDSVVRDSLLRASAVAAKKKRPSMKERTAIRLATAARDSMVKEIERRRNEIFITLRADTAQLDSTLRRVVSRDSVTRDSAAREMRLGIHVMSDEVERIITGTRGIAATRIAYVQGSHLRVIDSDGAYDRIVHTTGSALSPSWHPSGESIVYADFNASGTQVAEVNLRSGTIRPLAGTRRGLNITPVYGPGGKEVVYASGGDVPADLVVAGTDGGPARPLGKGGFENTSPSYSPDGMRLAFVSPRPLTPQIYAMNADGTKVKLLTPFAKGKRSYRTSPDWSPSGDAVAYEQQNGDFQVWMIALKSGKMTRLTSIAENEDPSWAPDGRHMAITSTRGGTREIWVLDTKTARFRQITRAAGARLSAWSPPLRPKL